ncbi:olfactory protein-like [Rhinophrynus dorsalis]
MPIAALLLLSLSIQAWAAEVPIQPDFDVHKFEGQWFGVAAASNCSVFMTMKKDMTMPIAIFMADGKFLRASFAYMTPKGCQQRDLKLETVSKGHYRLTGPGNMDMRIIGTDYVSHALEYTRNVLETGEVTIMLKLYGRNHDLPKEVEMKFVEFCKSMGLKEENMVKFNKGVDCVPGTF